MRRRHGTPSYTAAVIAYLMIIIAAIIISIVFVHLDSLNHADFTVVPTTYTTTMTAPITTTTTTTVPTTTTTTVPPTTTTVPTTVTTTTVLPTTTPAPICGGPSLGTAGCFGALGASTVTNTGGTVATGDVGSSPTPTVTGFPPGTATGTIHVTNDAAVISAHDDAQATFNCVTALPCDTDLSGQDLGTLILTPAVYCFSSSAQLTGTLTLDGLSLPNATWIFQIGTTLTTASSASVVFQGGGGGNATDVTWAVGSSATFGTSTSFQGNTIAAVSITATTSATFMGSLIALSGAVTLDTNTIVAQGSCL